MTKQGIKFLMNTKLESGVNNKEKGVEVTLEGKSGNLSIWLNGTKKEDKADTSTINTINNSPLYIGCRGGAPTATSGSGDFNVGEIIELSPYIEDDMENFKGVMRDYVFKKDNKAIAVFGYVSLCNHKDEPNALWKIIDSNFVIIARYTIKKDEEIFISYGTGYWDTRNLEKL
jgi:hypothetical protein